MPEDHDIIIQLETSQKILCQKLDKVEKKIDKFIEIADSKLSWKPLFALIGTAVLVMGTIIGYNYTVDASQWKLLGKHSCDISDIKTDTKTNQIRIEGLKDALEKDSRNK